jgi:hypothetical protein
MQLRPAPCILSNNYIFIITDKTASNSDLIHASYLIIQSTETIYLFTNNIKEGMHCRWNYMCTAIPLAYAHILQNPVMSQSDNCYPNLAT